MKKLFEDMVKVNKTGLHRWLEAKLGMKKLLEAKKNRCFRWIWLKEAAGG